jgi:mannose-6-phosphate isomerase-like protein (cupin superfamily)
MPAETFDWRDDPQGTMVATPQVRARFIRVEPGQERGGFHSHEESEAIETWVVLEGTVKFEFEDRTVLATAGQAVFAYPYEQHRVSCGGETPAVYFLTVSPHRSPTHTHYDAQGQRLPSRPGVTNPTWRGQPARGPLPT